MIYQGLCVSEVHVLVSRRGIRTIVHLFYIVLVYFQGLLLEPVFIIIGLVYSVLVGISSYTLGVIIIGVVLSFNEIYYCILSN